MEKLFEFRGDPVGVDCGVETAPFNLENYVSLNPTSYSCLNCNRWWRVWLLAFTPLCSSLTPQKLRALSNSHTQIFVQTQHSTSSSLLRGKFVILFYSYSFFFALVLIMMKDVMAVKWACGFCWIKSLSLIILQESKFPILCQHKFYLIYWTCPYLEFYIIFCISYKIYALRLHLSSLDFPSS